jgi:hypothetical protein
MKIEIKNTDGGEVQIVVHFTAPRSGNWLSTFTGAFAGGKMTAGFVADAIQRQFIASLEKAGEKLVSYGCPSCSFVIKSRVPARGDRYDTIATCPSCKKMHYRVVFDNEKIHVGQVPA